MKKEIESYLYLEGLSLAVENISKENDKLKKEILIQKKKTKTTNIVLFICIIVSFIIGMIGLWG
ncbi:MAG: hypothetical protein ACRC5R_03295 [Mycoplasmatales bacterium]